MNYIHDLIKRKYHNYYGTIYENRDSLEKECLSGEVYVIHGRYWEEFGFTLAEITDNNMWSEIVVIKK